MQSPFEPTQPSYSFTATVAGVLIDLNEDNLGQRPQPGSACSLRICTSGSGDAAIAWGTANAVPSCTFETGYRLLGRSDTCITIPSYATKLFAIADSADTAISICWGVGE